MTVTANTTRNAYSAGNQQNTYAYTFQIHDASDLKVYIGDELKSLNTHYTVTGVGSGTGGNVVFDLGVDGNGDQIYIPENTVVSIFLAMDLDRDTNYQPSGAFLASTVNNDFDRLWLASNQQQTDINRSVRLKDLDSQADMTLPLLADRADKLFAFSASASGAKPTAVTNNSSQWDSAYNDKINSAQFSGGTYTLTQQDGGTIATSFDGRYHLIGTDIPDADISESSVTQHRTAMLDLADNEKIKLGNSDDLQIYHDGSDSIIKDSGTGNLVLEAQDFQLRSSDGSERLMIAGDENGATALYYNGDIKAQTTATGMSITGTLSASEIDLEDNERIKIGNSDQLQIYHTGSSALIQESGDGDLGILGANIVIANADASKNYIGCTDGANVTLYYNGNPKLNTVASGIDVAGTVEFDGLSGTGSVNVTDILDEDNMASNSDTALATQQSIKAYVDANSGTATGVDLADNVKATFGDGDDLEIYHNGNNSFIADTGTGNLYLRAANNIFMQGATANEDMAHFVENGSVKLFHNNVEKFKTTATGIEVTGTVDTDGLTVDTDTLYVDTANNKVGIGTTSPESTLHVNGVLTTTANPVIKKNVPVIEFRSPDGTNGMNIKANLNNTNNYGLQIEDVNALNKVVIDPSGDVSFYNETSDDTAKFRWDASTERLGIGTDSPSTALDVNGTVTATAFSGDGSALTGLPAGGISNVVEDTTPQLGGDLDAQDNEINNVDKLGINTSSPSVACDVQFVKTGDLVAGLRVHTSAATSFDGKVITWGEQTAERGVLGWADAFGVDSCYIASGAAGLRFQRTFGSTPKIVPCDSGGSLNDNSIDLGDSNARFDDIYATNTSIISSSDSTLKQDIETLTDAEERVAVACKGLLRKFRWRNAVEEKGDEARIHFGIMAQDLRDAFTAEGLDAGRYGMFISNTWWEHEGEIYPTSDSAPEGATEITRLGVRYTELLAFIISAI
jgi:hypothetical protein